MTQPRRVLAAVMLAAAALFAARVHAITYGAVDTTNAFGNTGAFIVKAPSQWPVASSQLPVASGQWPVAGSSGQFAGDWRLATGNW